MSQTKKTLWLAWAVTSLFYAYQYILRVMPNIMLNDIMQKFKISSAIFGQFSGAYYLGYCLMHLPLGIMIDKYGPKKVMSTCILITVLGLLPIIFSDNWIYPILGRFLIGAGSSAAILGTFKIIRIAFNEKQFTKMLSFSVTIGLIGAIYGGTPMSYFCKIFGYKIVVEALALIGIIMLIITYLVIPEDRSNQDLSIKKDLVSVLHNKKVLLVCILAGFMVGPLEGFADAWGSEFLKLRYGLDSVTANYIISLIYMGMCFAPFLSKIAETTDKYLETIAGAGFCMLSIFIIMLAGIFNVKLMAVSFFILGICCSYQILAIYQASTYVPHNISGITAAIANMIIMSFGYVFHSIIGLLVKLLFLKGKYYAILYGVSFVPIMLFIGTTGFFIIAKNDKKS